MESLIRVYVGYFVAGDVYAHKCGNCDLGKTGNEQQQKMSPVCATLRLVPQQVEVVQSSSMTYMVHIFEIV